MVDYTVSVELYFIKSQSSRSKLLFGKGFSDKDANALQNGHTLLEGTTWYVNKIKPGLYWTVWSDYIVHKIHTRVLEHIKTHAEQRNE